MMLAGIHHVAIIAGDYARSKRFYCQILGLRVLDEHYRQARDSWKLDLALPDGGQIELFSFPAAPARPSRPEAQGLRHLAFRVADLDSAVARTSMHPAWRPKTSASTNTPAAALPFLQIRTGCRWSCTRSASAYA